MLRWRFSAIILGLAAAALLLPGTTCPSYSTGDPTGSLPSPDPSPTPDPPQADGPLPPDGTGGGTSSGYCEPTATPRSSTHNQMFTALNQHRAQQGVPVLLYSRTLESAADAHAQDMYRRNFFDHINPDGEGSGERLQRAGFCDPITWGENIAFGQTTVAEVQNGWANSPGHNTNMLRTTFVFVGMGHYQTPTGEHYWVQDFGTPGS